MSSIFPPSSPNPRPWWSLAPKPTPTEARKPPPTEKKPTGFKVIATAMGFKSKKNLASAVPDSPNYPAFPRISTHPNVPDIPPERSSPSKSLSSTRTRVDSLEPRTPLDVQRDSRPSLFTLSDTDPFATRSLNPSLSPSDPSHLAYYSNPSIPDFNSKRTDLPTFNRVSYASSSSRLSGERSPISPTDAGIRKLKPRKSSGSLQPKPSFMIQNASLGSLPRPTGNVSYNSPSRPGNLVDKNRFSQPDPTKAPRPAMRPRGLTDSGANPRPGFIVDEMPSKSSTSTSLRVIVRQPSASRIGLPPSAPPKQELPPPPTPPLRGHGRNSDGRVSSTAGSMSSSSFSFTSSRSSQMDVHAHGLGDTRRHDSSSGHVEAEGSRHVPSKAIQHSSTPRMLKKSLSHQSLSKLRIQTANHPAPTSPMMEPGPDKIPRKQRSFHHQKPPLPPVVPLPTRTGSVSTGSALSEGGSPIVEQRRGSAGLISIPSIPVRKRLFSGGSSSYRPSTAQSIMSEDDNRSLFSIRSDTMGSSIFKPWARPLSPSSPTSAVLPTATPPWEEVPQEPPPASPSVASEYTPQQILSPDEMAELEASVEESLVSQRQRGLSMRSPTRRKTSDKDDDSILDFLPSDPPTRKSTGSIEPPTRSQTILTGALTLSRQSSHRPSTSQVSITEPFSPTVAVPSPNALPSENGMTSLPPPPRKLPSKTMFVASPQPDDTFGMTSLPPPPRKTVRPKMSIEKVLQRRSVMRKPSFLEIDDDTEDEDTDVDSFLNPPGGSFLDFARESFDTDVMERGDD